MARDGKEKAKETDETNQEKPAKFKRFPLCGEVPTATHSPTDADFADFAQWVMFELRRVLSPQSFVKSATKMGVCFTALVLGRIK